MQLLSSAPSLLSYVFPARSVSPSLLILPLAVKSEQQPKAVADQLSRYPSQKEHRTCVVLRFILHTADSLSHVFLIAAPSLFSCSLFPYFVTGPGISASCPAITARQQGGVGGPWPVLPRDGKPGELTRSLPTSSGPREGK